MPINVGERNEGKSERPLITGKHVMLAEKICKELSETSGNKFIMKTFSDKTKISCINTSRVFSSEHKESYLRYPFKLPNGRELGQIYTEGDLDDIYIDGRKMIKWPDDWMDPYPIFIETVVIFKDYVQIWVSGIDMQFLCEYYYALWPLIILYSSPYRDHMTLMLIERKDRMKAARLMPGIIKDIEVFLKSLKQSVEKHNIDWTEANYGFSNLDASFMFRIAGMNDEQIINGVLKRIDALIEHAKRMRLEWFPSDKRREYYETTRLFKQDPFRLRSRIRKICKWPFVSKVEELNRLYEIKVRYSLYDSIEDPKEGIYNLDGYKLTVKEYRICKDKNGFKYVEGEILLDKHSKLYKFPLEKIEFLKEDFPEMFK